MFNFNTLVFMQTDFKYADLMNDDVFKLVFGQESSKDVMIEFLNLVITDRVIVDLDFMDKEMKALDRDRKDSVYDMFCKTDDGSRIVVEVQRRKQDTYIERSIYYSTFQIRNQVDAGSDTYAFCPVYVINILDFNIEENRGNPNVKTVFHFYEEKTHTLLTDKLTLIYLELGKFKKTLEELDGDVLDGFYFCLKNMHRMESRPEVLEHDIFKRMFDISELIRMDDVTRSKVLMKMTTERDLRNQMAYARKEAIAEGLAEGRERGLAEGRAEGRVEGMAEAARRMLASGFSSEQIAEILQLNVDQVSRMTCPE